MATILAYTSPALGHAYPISALLVELRRRGHAIVLRTLTAAVGTGRELGFDASEIDPRIEAIVMDDWTAPNAKAALARAFDVLGRRAAHEVDDLRAAIDEVRPDALIIDANCWGAASVADASDLPWLSFWPYIPYLRSRGVPPFGPGLRPWPGPIGHIRDGLLRPMVTGALEKAMLSPLNRIRMEVGAPPVASADDFVCRPPLVLVGTGTPFEYPHPDWQAVQMIGACDFNPQAGPAPEWLTAIERPIVLVATSSERQGDSELVRTAMAALADDPVQVVATMPAGVPDDIDLPANATVCDFVPHGPVLDRAVCAITHGGMGVTQKALVRGVPVCAVPFGRDQFEVARRVEVAQCGTRLPAKKLSIERLRANVHRAMGMSEGARRVAEGLRAAGGAVRGADLVERRLLSRNARPAPGAARKSS